MACGSLKHLEQSQLFFRLVGCIIRVYYPKKERRFVVEPGAVAGLGLLLAHAPWTEVKRGRDESALRSHLLLRGVFL